MFQWIRMYPGINNNHNNARRYMDQPHMYVLVIQWFSVVYWNIIHKRSEWIIPIHHCKHCITDLHNLHNNWLSIHVQWSISWPVPLPWTEEPYKSLSQWTQWVSDLLGPNWSFESWSPMGEHVCGYVRNISNIISGLFMQKTNLYYGYLPHLEVIDNAFWEKYQVIWT